MPNHIDLVTNGTVQNGTRTVNYGTSTAFYGTKKNINRATFVRCSLNINVSDSVPYFTVLIKKTTSQ